MVICLCQVHARFQEQGIVIFMPEEAQRPPLANVEAQSVALPNVEAVVAVELVLCEEAPGHRVNVEVIVDV